MSQGQHSTRSRLGSRILIGLLSLVTCAGLTFGLSPGAFAVSTTQLQWDLAGMAYLSFSGIDGVAGPATTAATKAFQTDACLAADGIDGPQTDAALSAKVKQVQAAAGTTQDGAFGPGTKSAVKAWQSAHGLTADGAAGPATMSAMGITRSSCSTPSGVKGMDVSSHQTNVDWAAAWSNGGRFAIVKATEGITYKSPEYAQQYNGSASVGMVRGAYHFALPGRSSGSVQADFFVNNGGGWTRDGKTLPPSLDIEYNPYSADGNSCYNLSQSAMVSWIHAFSNQVKARTGRDPIIYTTTDWWTTCTGNSSAFGVNPLWIARYSSSPGTLPAGWSAQTIWQNADAGVLPGDQNIFNGNQTALVALANG
ncbi:MAG: GH25 family lysozyme [Pseudonocardiales bacterium]